MYKKTCCHVAYFRIFKIVVKIRLDLTDTIWDREEEDAKKIDDPDL